MFQMTLGTWVPVARDVQELLSPAFNLLTILFKGIFGFAAVGVINGVFMQETLKVAQTDDIIMMRDVARREQLGFLGNVCGFSQAGSNRWFFHVGFWRAFAYLTRKLHARKMKKFFRYTDHARSTITRAEWKRVMERDDTRHWFGAQGLPIRDPDMIFNLIDTDNSESISMEELVSGVSQLQGVASGVDIAMLKRSQGYLVALTEKLLQSTDTTDTAYLPPELRERTSL